MGNSMGIREAAGLNLGETSFLLSLHTSCARCPVDPLRQKTYQKHQEDQCISQGSNRTYNLHQQFPQMKIIFFRPPPYRLIRLAKAQYYKQCDETFVLYSVRNAAHHPKLKCKSSAQFLKHKDVENDV